jgi:iron-sulfur cluster assembly accessory protein
MGIEIDYDSEIFGSTFKFNNPQAKSQCGCGTSFSI